MNTYITLLSSDDYILPLLSLNQNLIDLKSKYPLFVIVSGDVNTKTVDILKEHNINYKITSPILYHPDIIKQASQWGQPQVVNTATKLEIFNTSFDKAVYLDADSFFIYNIDNLFNYPDGSMYEECGCDGGFSGLFTFMPKNHNFEYYKNIIQNIPILDGDLLANLWFPFKSNQEYHISPEYFLNITLDNLDNHINTAKGFHFCYKYKPWNYKSAEEFNNDFYNGLNKPYSKLRTAVIETYLKQYINTFSKEI